MSKDNVVSLAAPASGVLSDPLTDLLRLNARRLIEVAVAAEFEEYLSAFGEERLPDGRRRVVRNGSHPERKILTGIGAVEVKAPKARSRSGAVAPFHSSVAPPFVRRCASLDAAIPWLYLRGISTGGMREAVSALIGERAAAGLSPNVVSRLKREWWDEYHAWRKRGLDDDWVYLWADGIHSGLRGDEGRLCALVVIGVNARGEKHFLAIEDGVRESTQSWREVLLDMKNRGLAKPPKLAVGDGALGFWSALSEVYPATRNQRCWMHKTVNALNYLPKSSQPKAKEGLHEIWRAETREQAERAFDHWLARYRDKYPKAADCLAKDRRELLAFYDFPAKHWAHLRTTNVIESAFATIRHRSSRTKGCVTRKTMLSMIYKMGMSAERSWKRLRGFRQLAQVIEGVQFKDGKQVINENSREAA
ncbi:MAG: IS256 family transposase [Gammaproteobacteria bacterium]|nr:IS256 family transposase [Gammaproteobacteria bacterium]MYH85302.1 IS256 family transposase [Gammaproteobacteria bacterium]MYK03808.1 IS256 family transposase [Gammaproteobacteria bacterium]